MLDVLDGPPYNLVLHTAPAKARVDETYHWHWEIHPRLREIAGLELGTGLPVNPVSPEEAVVGAARRPPDRVGGRRAPQLGRLPARLTRDCAEAPDQVVVWRPDQDQPRPPRWTRTGPATSQVPATSHDTL